MRLPNASPFAVTQDMTGLQYLNVEVSLGGEWVSVNDHEKYRINSEVTRDTSTKSWRKQVATSPVLGGSYLVHAVPDMVTEQVGIWIHGNDQTDLADNIFFLDELFEQPSYRIRWTMNEYREYWDCQLAEASVSRGQVWTHSMMAMAAYTIPRFPRVTRERL